MLLNRQAGISLLEVLVFVGVLATITLSVLSVGGRQRVAFETQQLSQRVESLLMGLNTYYEAHCASGSDPAVSIGELVSEGMIPSVDLGDNPFGGQLGVHIQWEENPVVLEVSGSFNTQQIAYLRRQLPPSRSLGQVVIWADHPRLIVDHENSEERLFLDMYRTPCF